MIIAAYLSLLIFGLMDNFRGPFFSAQLSEFHLTEAKGAAIFGLTSVFASLSAAFGGPLLRRMGVAGLMNFSSLCMAGGFAVMALSPQWIVLLMGAALFGAGLGFASIAQNVAVAEYAPVLRRSQMMSGLHAMYALASAFAPGIAHGLLLAGWTWRQSFLMVSLLPASLGIIGFYWQHRTRLANLHNSKITLLKLAWPHGMRLHVILFAFATALYLLAEISIGTRLVRWLEVVHQRTAAEGSLDLMWFFIALFVGRTLTWRWAPSSAKGLKQILLLSILAGLCSLLWTLWSWPQAVILVGLSLGPFYPLAMAYARVRYHKHAPQAFTMIIAMGSAVVVTMHFLIGWIADHYGLQMAMQVGPVGLLLCLFILLFERDVRA